MAIIRYGCTVCKRELEIPENKRGLEVIHRCIITDGCRGYLYKLERKQDFIRGEFPSKVPGLIDFTARRVLYNHEQAVAAREWYVVHNLGVAPSVQVLVNRSVITSEIQEEIPCILRNNTETFEQVETTDFTKEITSPNTLTIRFTDPQSGLAQMIARSTAPVVTEEVVATTSSTFQITNDSLLTIATLNNTIPSTQSVNINIVFTPPGEASLSPITYTASSSVASESPWNDFSTILIQGKQYKVRSFDTYITEMANGTIPNGSSFYINKIGVGSPLRTLTTGEVIILLALSPYADIDKITNQLIDTNRIDATNAELALFYQSRELYAFTSIISSTFPPIREV